MKILRVEFIGYTVAGPRGSTRANYKPGEWPGWTARAEGHAVLFEGDGKRVEVPRNLCVIQWDMEPAKPEIATVASWDAAIRETDPPKRRGRPPKSVASDKFGSAMGSVEPKGDA